MITFPWTKVAFAPGFAPEYFLPLLICSFITTAETIGDVEMTAKFSKVTDPQEVNDRKQGGVMADGVNSIVACLLGSPPNTTFSQNNGILSLTKCASRSAGFACAGWLMFIGIFGKVRTQDPSRIDGNQHFVHTTCARAAPRRGHRLAVRWRPSPCPSSAASFSSASLWCSWPACRSWGRS